MFLGLCWFLRVLCYLGGFVLVFVFSFLVFGVWRVVVLHGVWGLSVSGLLGVLGVGSLFVLFLLGLFVVMGFACLVCGAVCLGLGVLLVWLFLLLCMEFGLVVVVVWVGGVGVSCWDCLLVCCLWCVVWVVFGDWFGLLLV